LRFHAPEHLINGLTSSFSTVSDEPFDDAGADAQFRRFRLISGFTLIERLAAAHARANAGFNTLLTRVQLLLIAT